MKTTLTISLILLGLCLFGQTQYIGQVAGDQILFSTDAHQFSETVTAVYSMGEETYPFWMTGKIKDGKLKLSEIMDDQLMSTIEIPDFDSAKKNLKGVMTFMGSGESFELTLVRDFSLEGENEVYANKRLEQLSKNEYLNFALKVSKTQADYYARITGLLVMDHNFEVIQEFTDLDCNSVRGYESVQLGDFNFDEVIDFRLFCEQYAGANTQSHYFIKNEDRMLFEYHEDLSQLTSADFDDFNQNIIERIQSGPEEVLNIYSFDMNGKLVKLNMLPDEYPDRPVVWNLTKTQEGDFPTQTDTGTVSFLPNGNIKVAFKGWDYVFEYRVKREGKWIQLVNVEMEEDIMDYTLEESSQQKQIWTRLENDNFETWVLTK